MISAICTTLCVVYNKILNLLQSMNNQHFFICTKIKAVDINYDNNV